MATAFGAQALYKRCTENISGILTSSYSADGSVDQTKTPDECGDNVKLVTKNVMTSHTWEGEVSGASPGGICNSKLGQSISAPAGIWYNNMSSPGSFLICTNGRYSENRGEWATFSITAENNAGI